MYNPFSFIPIMVKKWTEGTRFDLVKMICFSILFILCILVLQKWNTVPFIKDSIYIATYKGKHTQKDSLGINVTYKHPYYNFSNLQENSASYVVGIIGSYMRDSTEYLDKNNNTEPLINILRNNVPKFNSDSVIMLAHVKTKMHTTNFHSFFKNAKSKSAENNGNVLFANVYTETTDTAWACSESILALSEKSNTFKNKSDVLVLMPAAVKGSVKLVINTFVNWFRMEDVSQCYYSMDIKRKNYEDRIGFLKIDFGGAIQFSHIYPTPDRIDYSSVLYNDQKKIEEIQMSGLKFYCQLLEANGLQSVRVYMLTTLATFFFGVALKILLELLWHVSKKIFGLLVKTGAENP